MDFLGDAPTFTEVELFLGEDPPTKWKFDYFRWILKEGDKLYLTSLRGVMIKFDLRT